MKYIALINSYEIQIDHDDIFSIVGSGAWHMNSSRSDIHGGRFYFTRNLPARNGHRECVRLHRMLVNADAGTIVDHVNGNTLDCRKENLRIVDVCTNTINSAPYTKHRGVSFEKKKKLWRARIQVNGKSISLGRFKNITDAIEAYTTAERTYGYDVIRSGQLTSLGE